jgi:protein-tyrosine phosphatase
MKTDLYWVDGAWPGRLAIMPRPRGGDWLEDEVRWWQKSGVGVVLSLLTHDEIADLNLNSEEEWCRANEIQFLSFAIDDRGVPASRAAVLTLGAELIKHLRAGVNVAIHCRQGIGRAALMAICILVLFRIDPELAIQKVSAARGCPVPETPEQRRWITEFVETASLSN